MQNTKQKQRNQKKNWIKPKKKQFEYDGASKRIVENMCLIKAVKYFLHHQVNGDQGEVLLNDRSMVTENILINI